MKGSCRTTTQRTLILGLAMVAGMTTASRAEVTKIDIRKRESPTFEGLFFGSTGPYEKLVGRYYGELDPASPSLASIADISLAQKNSRGQIEYSADFYILKPVQMDHGNRTVFYEFGNRGNKYLLGQYNQYSPNQPWLNDPTLAKDAGNGFLMRHGFALVWSGLLGDVLQINNNLAIQLPIAKNADGSVIEDVVWDECFNDFWAMIDTDLSECALSYPVPDLDKRDAKLVVRERRNDEPVEIPSERWEFWGNNSIRLLPLGTQFKAGMIYQFIHKAANPPVMGIGLAAVRDWIAFLRNQGKDKFGTANPLWKSFSHVLSYGASQTGRVSLEFLYRGFNEDISKSGQKIFDAMTIQVAATRPFLNFRFAQPKRAADFQHESLFYPTSVFPFAYEDQRDPLSKRVDGIFHLCSHTGTCPKVMHTVTSTEYWQMKNSIVTTDPLGTEDAQIPKNVRVYLFSGTTHFPDTRQGVCERKGVDLSYFPFSRALLISLQKWVADGTIPPETQIPTLAQRNLVDPQQINWPAIPMVASPSLLINRHRIYDYGPEFWKGIITRVLPLVTQREYSTMVPQVDVDGNEIAGIRHPAISVPTATYTGWNRRARAEALGELCGLRGSWIPFPRTLAEKVASGDPRLSIEERYTGLADYRKRVESAFDRLEKQNLVFKEDRELVVNQALEKWNWGQGF